MEIVTCYAERTSLNSCAILLHLIRSLRLFRCCFCFYSAPNRRTDITEHSFSNIRVMHCRFVNSCLERGSNIFCCFLAGVGEKVERNELNHIANKPSNEFVFMVDDYSSLGIIKEMLAIKTCQGTHVLLTAVTSKLTSLEPLNALQVSIATTSRFRWSEHKCECFLAFPVIFTDLEALATNHLHGIVVSFDQFSKELHKQKQACTVHVRYTCTTLQSRLHVQTARNQIGILLGNTYE